MPNNFIKSLCFLALVHLAFIGNAQPSQLTFTTFASGLNKPLFVTHAGDERVFIVEKDGYIRIASQQGVVQTTAFLNIDARVKSTGNEQGLLGLAFHPNYKNNGYFYVNYTNSTNETVVSRFSVSATNPNLADANSELILINIPQPYTNHNGGCLLFGHDGYLYIGMGDGGSGGDPNNYAQSTTSLLGKMLRLDVDNGNPYAIPPSNPYVGSSPIPDEIWAFGLRNPWRFSFDRWNGDLWIGDVGQDAWEEVDYVAFGSDPAPNFGWRCFEGNAPYNPSGCQPSGSYDAPIYVYANNGSTGCSMTGGYRYRGGRFSSMNGTYFHTDYCTGFIWQTRSNGSGGWTTTQGSAFQSYDLVSFGEDAFGELYIMGLSSGTIWRMSDTTSQPNALIWERDTVSICAGSYTLRAAGTPALGYQWLLNGSPIPNADTLVYDAVTTGDYQVVVTQNGFSDTSQVVRVDFIPAPSISFSGLDTLYCDNAAAVPLIGLPAGGIFSGPGVVDTTFNPVVAQSGSHVITYTVDNGNGCISTFTDTTTVQVCVGIRPADLLPGFSVFPNPNNGQFAVEFQFPGEQNADWVLRDLHGKQVAQGLLNARNGMFRHDFNSVDLPGGMYMLSIQVAGKWYSARVALSQ